MRTTVRLDETLLAEAKKLAADTHRTLTSVIEDSLREIVNRRSATNVRTSTFKIPTFRGRGLRPGVDLDSSASLLDVMDDLR